MQHLFNELVPSYIRGLTVLNTLIEKAEQHAKREKFPVENLLVARLAPDMHTFIQQVQYAYFTVIESMEHLTSRTPPQMNYSETSAKDLKDSLKKVLTYLGKIQSKDFKEEENGTVESYLSPGKKLPIFVYVRFASLPNFYFHLTTAYDILRHNGVRIGKDDYIGKLPKTFA